MIDTPDEAFEFAAMRAKARALPPMTEAQRGEQGMSFAYGQLACTTNHKPTRAAFAELAASLGWSHERFESWAGGKEWRTP